MMAEHIIHKRRGRLPSIEVVDLFCGIGGLSYGMKSKGLKILEGFDLDATCQYAYETNNEAYSVACSCAVNLYPHLKELGLLCFVGYNDTFIVRGDREPFVISALSGLKNFLSGSNIKASKEKMQATFDEQIAILNETAPWAAVDLVHNKEALVFEGENALDFSSLTNEESVPNNQLKTS